MNSGSKLSVCVCVFVRVLYFSGTQQVQCRTRKGSPVIWSEGMTVEVAAINEETCPLNHILCYHTETIQHIAQLTKGKGKWKVDINNCKKQNQTTTKKTSQFSEAAMLANTWSNVSFIECVIYLGW